jgi:hypothetical protein
MLNEREINEVLCSIHIRGERLFYLNAGNLSFAQTYYMHKEQPGKDPS